MLISLNDALKWHVSVEDDRFRLSDFLLDPDTHRPVYMILDLGGWFETDHALVAVSLMQHPDPDRGVLPLAIRADELRQAPHWQAPTLSVITVLPVKQHISTMNSATVTNLLLNVDEKTVLTQPHQQ